MFFCLWDFQNAIIGEANSIITFLTKFFLIIFDRILPLCLVFLTYPNNLNRLKDPIS